MTCIRNGAPAMTRSKHLNFGRKNVRKLKSEHNIANGALSHPRKDWKDPTATWLPSMNPISKDELGCRPDDMGWMSSGRHRMDVVRTTWDINVVGTTYLHTYG